MSGAIIVEENMKVRRSNSAEARKKPERLSDKAIELGPVQVEMLKVLLRDVAYTGQVSHVPSQPLRMK